MAIGKKSKTIVYGIDDLTDLVLEENFPAAEEVIMREGVKIKYSDDNKGRKRQKMSELRDLAYSLQRDMRAMQYDTSYIRNVLKGLNTGSSY